MAGNLVLWCTYLCELLGQMANDDFPGRGLDSIDVAS